MKKDVGLAFLRISASALLLTHGVPKFLKLLSGSFEFGDPIGIGTHASLILATLGEFVCPILILIGYKTRWAAVLPAIVMLVAIFFAHASDPFGRKEKAILFLVMFIAIILLGPGKYSLDRN